MKKCLLLLILIVSAKVCWSQKNIAYLDDKNGFKGIVLGADKSTLNQKLLEKIDASSTDTTITYKYNDTSLLKINDDMRLIEIGVTIYKNKILKITLIYDKENGSELTLLFMKAYGLYTSRPNRFMDNYYWYGKNVKLFLSYEGKFGYAIFTCNPLQSEIDSKKNNSDNKTIQGF
jgi:hypothetical protein